LGESFSTRETVWYETPAIRATSRMFGARAGLDSVLTIVPTSSAKMCTFTFG
jgi:hypothetical protein